MPILGEMKRKDNFWIYFIKLTLSKFKDNNTKRKGKLKYQKMIISNSHLSDIVFKQLNGIQ